MRYDALQQRIYRLAVNRIHLEPAQDLADREEEGAWYPGDKVAQDFGLLVHFASRKGIAKISRNDDAIGPRCWLTPLKLAACLLPYNLGLPEPKNRAVIVDPSMLNGLWGPGIAPPSPQFGGVWPGGGIEFFCTELIPRHAIRAMERLEPSGDTV